MIASNLKERFYTSFFLLILLLTMFKVELVFFYFLIILSILSIIEFLTMTKKFVKKKFNFLLINFLFIFYISFFCFINVIFYNHYPLKLILFILILCCVGSDIGGFLFGKIFKGPKLTKISPNKTITGAIGSIFFSTLILIFLFNLLTINFNTSSLLIGIITSINCQIGDLFFSFIKRKANLKDTGNFLPGHGGILDRVDGILLGVPAGMIVIFYLI